MNSFTLLLTIACSCGKKGADTAQDTAKSEQPQDTAESQDTAQSEQPQDTAESQDTAQSEQPQDTAE